MSREWWVWGAVFEEGFSCVSAREIEFTCLPVEEGISRKVFYNNCSVTMFDLLTTVLLLFLFTPYKRCLPTIKSKGDDLDTTNNI